MSIVTRSAPDPKWDSDFPEDSLPRGEATEVLDHPEDWQGEARGGQRSHYWVTDPVAVKWHDCTTCRAIIGPGDPYRRTAIPCHTHWVIWKECWLCLPGT